MIKICQLSLVLLVHLFVTCHHKGIHQHTKLYDPKFTGASVIPAPQVYWSTTLLPWWERWNYQAGKNSNNMMLTLSSTKMCPLGTITCVSDVDSDNGSIPNTVTMIRIKISFPVNIKSTYNTLQSHFNVILSQITLQLPCLK